MKNINYFPFERNHYYYGKLLTVDDFELEQRYSNNKRRMSNRFLHGSGVVNGMQIVGIDDQTIALQMGIALDFAGREIVVEEPVTKKLSSIEGFEAINEGDQDTVYLCIEYDEREKEAVYNIAGGQSSNSQEFNKYKESYRLFLSSTEPKSLNYISNMSVYQEKTTVYMGNGIRINQMMPRFVKSGSNINIEVEIENLGQQQNFAFSYELDLKYLKYKGLPGLKVDFDESLESKSLRYKLNYPVTVLDVADVSAEAAVNKDSFRISVSRNQVKGEAGGKSESYIVSENAGEALINNYYETHMQQIVSNVSQEAIYLAKLVLVRAGSSYIIQEMEAMPFNQYIWSSNLSFAANQVLNKEIEDIKKLLSLYQNTDKSEYITEDKKEKKLNKFGVVKLFLGKNRHRGKRFYTEEIVHGLGIGNVSIIMGIEDCQGKVTYGSSEIFTQDTTMMELAAQVDNKKGTFVIGARLLEGNKHEQYNIHWTAMLDKDSIDEDLTEKKITICPNVLNIRVRETHYLEAVCQNMNDKRLKWKVEQYGGIIDRNGMYTAPDKPGVYEVTAVSVVYPDVESSIFIVVDE